jgi:hypothetical protein
MMCWENLKESCDMKDIDVDARIILKWILNNMGGCGLYVIESRESGGPVW